MTHLSSIQTKRLKLRPVTPDVYEQIFKGSQEEIMEFFGITEENEFIKEKNRFENGLRTYNKTFLFFQIIEAQSEQIIGWCGYHTWYLDHQRAEIGYGLNSDEFKRKGYMTEALASVIDYGFREMNLHRIEALASPKNTPSVKLLNAFKFEYEGLMKEHYLIDGVHEDSAVYGLLRTNYLKTE